MIRDDIWKQDIMVSASWNMFIISVGLFSGSFLGIADRWRSEHLYSNYSWSAAQPISRNAKVSEEIHKSNLGRKTRNGRGSPSGVLNYKNAVWCFRFLHANVVTWASKKLEHRCTSFILCIFTAAYVVQFDFRKIGFRKFINRSTV